MCCAAWLNVLAWSRKNAWHKAAELDWTLDGKIVGRRKKVGPLTFVKIFGAGHMVSLALCMSFGCHKFP
jgi:carboxypeptidase C (cathepsin A)